MRNGEWAFPEVNDRFEMLKQERVRVMIMPDANEQRIIELRREMEKLRKENRQLALEVNRIGGQVLEERNRANRMADYERQNISLREAINRTQQARSARGGGRV
jgi:hypothetical protein